jgi:hypothetical protein
MNDRMESRSRRFLNLGVNFGLVGNTEIDVNMR